MDVPDERRPVNALAAGPGAPITHLLYLHGFRSSPQSTKARFVAGWLRGRRADIAWCCPQLPPSPRRALDESLAATRGWPSESMAVIGSSLGGFYATAIAEARGCRAVLLNPAIDPARDLAACVGEQTAWHDGNERFCFDAAYVDELRAIAPPARLTRLDRYLAVIAKGDEVLSWHEMSARYAGCRTLLIDGSDHALGDFAAHWPTVVEFLGLADG